MDKIVAATQFRDHVLVFTEQGKIYRVSIDPLTERLFITLMHQFDFTL